MTKKIAAAIMLLSLNGYTVSSPPQESEYRKALRTGVKPAIWPPIVMNSDDLNHFRQTHGLSSQ